MLGAATEKGCLPEISSAPSSKRIPFVVTNTT